MSTLEEQNGNLKAKRGAAKGSITRLLAKMDKLMANSANVDEVKNLQPTLEDAYKNFCYAHDLYHASLTVEDDVDESRGYWDDVAHQVDDFRYAVDQWMADVLEEDPPRPEQDDIQTILQQLQSLKETRAKEREEFQLRLEAQRLELELARQRQVQELEIERERLHTRLEMQQLDSERNQLMWKSELELKQSTPAFQTETYRSVPERDTLGKRSAKPPQPSFGASVISDLPQANSSAVLADTISQMLETSRIHQQSLVDSLHAPRIEMMRIDGNPLKYWPFMRSFHNAVASRTSDDGLKLGSLIQYCSGNVGQLLQCCLVKEPSDGYKLALKLLKDRYGNDDVISRAWIDRILDRPKMKDTRGLRAYADDLRTCKETLTAMECLQELETRSSLKTIIAKLPDRECDRWLKVNYDIKSQKKRNPNLEDIIDFVDRVAQEVSDPVFDEPSTSTTPVRTNLEEAPFPLKPDLTVHPKNKPEDISLLQRQRQRLITNVPNATICIT